MKRKKLWAGLAILASLLLVAACRHGGDGWRCGSGHKDPAFIVDWISGELDLTEEQESVLSDIATEMKEKVDGYREERGKVKEDLASLIRRERLESADVERVVALHMGRMEEFATFAGERFAEFHAVLKLEQREKLAEKILSHGSGIFSLPDAPPWGFAQIFLHHHRSFVMHFSRQITNAGRGGYGRSHNHVYYIVIVSLR